MPETATYTGSAVPGNLTYCQRYQATNPYCGVFGAGEVIEVAFVAVFAVVGTLGNLLVIASIVFENRVYKNGNIFVINLALADLIITGFFLPTVALNIVNMENALPKLACDFAGYVVTVTCACSVCNMAFIALTRYCFVVHNKRYNAAFSKRNILFMVLFTWIWSNLIAFPILFGPSSLKYDEKMAQCGWDDQASLAYNVILMVCAIFIPVTVIVFCYWRLFLFVRSRGRQVGRHTESARSKNSAQQQNRMKREMTLLKTLAVTVAFFIFCWLPYGVVVLFFAHNVPPHVKKTASRLGLFNSSMNVIIYGVMNPIYRKGYFNFLLYLSCCKESCKRTFSEISNSRVNESTLREGSRQNNHNSGISKAKLEVELTPSSKKGSSSGSSMTSQETTIKN